jgi:ABC-2 type transport system permease protein
VSPIQKRSRRTPSGWVQLKSVFRKEVLQTVRDKRIMVLLTVAPLIQTIVFGFAVDFDVDRVPSVVVDHDATLESRAHERSLLADGTLVASAKLSELAQAERQLDEGEAAAIVVLPKGLERNLLAGRPAEVQVVLDGTDPNRATVAAGAVSRYFGEVGRELASDRMRQAGFNVPSVTVVPRVLYNPSLRTPPFIIPGVMGMLLLIVTTIVTAMGLARERETGTLEQVLVTPIRPVYLLIGKMAPFLVIGFIDVGLVLTGGAYLFDVPLRGNLAVVALAAVLYLMSTLGMGLLISTISKTQQQSFLGGFLFTLPAILLSGVMTPIAAMPPWLQLVTALNPVRYFVEVMRAVLLKSATLSDTRPQLLALLAFGVAIISLSAVRFRKTLQ